MHANTPGYHEGDKEKIYKLEGPLFFGSIESFMALFDPKDDPETVIIDFAGSRVVEHSGLQAIEALAAKYEANGTKLKLRHLSNDCKTLLKKAGQLVEPAEDDPEYAVATDYDLQTGRLDAGH